MSLGVPSRDVALRMGSDYRSHLAKVEEAKFAAFRTWLRSLSPEDLVDRYDISGSLLADILQAASRHSRNPLLQGFSGVEVQLPIAGIARATRRAIDTGLLAALREDDIVQLARDYANAYDRNAIALVRDGATVAYLPRDLSQLLALDLDRGLSLEGRVTSSEPESLEIGFEVRRSIVGASDANVWLR